MVVGGPGGGGGTIGTITTGGGATTSATGGGAIPESLMGGGHSAGVSATTAGHHHTMLNSPTPPSVSTATTAGSTTGGSISGAGGFPIGSGHGETVPSLRSFTTAVNPSLGGIENVDSIILIYDLDRDETFFRLENHWLPLIERCYNGAVSFGGINS